MFLHLSWGLFWYPCWMHTSLFFILWILPFFAPSAFFYYPLLEASSASLVTLKIVNEKSKCVWFFFVLKNLSFRLRKKGHFILWIQWFKLWTSGHMFRKLRNTCGLFWSTLSKIWSKNQIQIYDSRKCNNWTKLWSIDWKANWWRIQITCSSRLQSCCRINVLDSLTL